MRKLTWSLSTLMLPLLTAVAPAAYGYDGSTFNQVWSKIQSDPYEKPHNQVTAASMFDYGRSLIYEAASRTITDKDDLLPRFTKLVHPNGICLKGTWTIDQDSPYSGYFKKGSKGLVIARLSAAFTPTEKATCAPWALRPRSSRRLTQSRKSLPATSLRSTTLPGPTRRILWTPL